MSDHCTIFARGSDVASVLAQLREYASLAIQVQGTDDAWDKVVVAAPAATLTLNALRWTQGGDQCSRMLLGAMHFFRRVRTDDAEIRARIAAHLTKCRLVIGVVGDPAFSDESGLNDMIMDAAEVLDGLIFNGRAMFDAAGVLLLDSDGSSGIRAA